MPSTTTNNNNNNNKAEIDRAISHILNANFDADSQVCLLTLIKLLDNVLQKPDNPKVRQIRKANPAFQQKVVNKGGVGVLLACGFIVQEQAPNIGQPPEEFLIFPQDNNSVKSIVKIDQARQMLAQVAIHQLKCPPDELPKHQAPKLSASGKAVNTTTNPFNPYQGHRFDGQSASVGTHLGPPPGWKSATDVKLQNLQKQQAKLKQKLQKPVVDRQWSASSPTEQLRVQVPSEELGGRNEDSKLLASHIQKQNLERQAAENRSFTTKAMRDLEQLQKQKLYSHSVLAIQFPDGNIVRGNFSPQ